MAFLPRNATLLPTRASARRSPLALLLLRRQAQ
jgi:hypothetical protein